MSTNSAVATLEAPLYGELEAALDTISNCGGTMVF